MTGGRAPHGLGEGHAATAATRPARTHRAGRASSSAARHFPDAAPGGRVRLRDLTNRGAHKLHNWGLLDRTKAELEVACRNCGLIERTGYYTGEGGRTLGMLRWITPQGQLLCIRPFGISSPGPPWGDRGGFRGRPCGRSPAMPKSVQAWADGDDAG